MNEEKEPIINGIDVSECKFYEEMRELPDNLNGGYYIQHCYCGLQGDNYCICNKNPDCYFKQFKRLQKENEGLKSLNDFNVQKIEVLKEENEKLKAENEQLKKPCLVMPKVKQLAVPIEKYEKLYKALEKIRKEANRLLYEENPIYGYNNSNHFEMLAKYVLAKTKEVLEDNENENNI